MENIEKATKEIDEVMKKYGLIFNIDIQHVPKVTIVEAPKPKVEEPK